MRFTVNQILTLYHPPSQKSTVYGRWKKTSLTAKLLVEPPYFFVTMSFVSSGTQSRLQTISLVLSFLSKRRLQVSSSLSSFSLYTLTVSRAYGDGNVMNANASSGFSLALNHRGCDLADSDVSASSAAVWSGLQRRGEKESWEEQDEDGDGVWRLVSRTRALKTRSSPGSMAKWSSFITELVWLGSHARRWRCEKWSGRG